MRKAEFNMSGKSISRREFLRVGVAGATGLAGLAALTTTQRTHADHNAPPGQGPDEHQGHDDASPWAMWTPAPSTPAPTWSTSTMVG